LKSARMEIKELDGASLESSVAIIRSAFGQVTGRFGITEENTPMFAAYITLRFSIRPPVLLFTADFTCVGSVSTSRSLPALFYFIGAMDNVQL
jgi:hypothetical protein